MATDTVVTELAHEVARLRRDLTDLASAVATLEARFLAAQRHPPAEQSAAQSVDQPAIVVPQRRPSSEERQRQEWIAGLPCHACKHPSGIDVRHLIAQDTLSPNRCTPTGLPLICCRVTHALRANTERTWADA
jgi:hypothetical protein